MSIEDVICTGLSARVREPRLDPTMLFARAGIPGVAYRAAEENIWRRVSTEESIAFNIMLINYSKCWGPVFISVQTKRWSNGYLLPD